jgi:uncharacterized metal-binding protein YceD (DUF177 family)
MEPLASEFSRVLPLEKVGQLAYTFNIEANERERELLTQRFNIRGIRFFKANFVIRKGVGTGEYTVDGSVVADVVQSCVVSLEDVPAHLEFPIHLLLRQGQEEDFALDIEANFEDNKVDLDFYQNYEIDLGELASQYLSLALDPYPRHSKVQDPVEETREEETGQEKNLNPFAVLQKLKS